MTHKENFQLLPDDGTQVKKVDRRESSAKVCQKGKACGFFFSLPSVCILNVETYPDDNHFLFQIFMPNKREKVQTLFNGFSHNLNFMASSPKSLPSCLQYQNFCFTFMYIATFVALFQSIFLFFNFLTARNLIWRRITKFSFN